MSIMFKCREAETFGNSSYFVDFFLSAIRFYKKNLLIQPRVVTL